VLPTAHPLAGRSSVTLAELVDDPFVDTPTGFGNRVILERELARLGLTRTISTVVADLGDVPPFVAAGLGIAVIPSSLLIPHARVVSVPVAPDHIDWTLSVISRERPTPAAAALLDLMRERLPTG
jgi:DNA-binding transcriptional LysR family regulator